MLVVKDKNGGAKDIGNRVFLVFGLVLVGTLTLLKINHHQEADLKAIATASAERLNEPSHLPHSTLLSELKSQQLSVELPTYVVAMTKQRVSNHQFWLFTEASGYVTYREKLNLSPNWRKPSKEELASNRPDLQAWQTAPEAPVTWLAREDAEAYCRWLNMCHPGFRLPSIEELNAAEKLEDPLFVASSRESWEWTSDTLVDIPTTIDETVPHSTEYLTAWQPNAPLHHRRTRDLALSSAEPISFRLIVD